VGVKKILAADQHRLQPQVDLVGQGPAELGDGFIQGDFGGVPASEAGPGASRQKEQSRQQQQRSGAFS